MGLGRVGRRVCGCIARVLAGGCGVEFASVWFICVLCALCPVRACARCRASVLWCPLWLVSCGLRFTTLMGAHPTPPLKHHHVDINSRNQVENQVEINR